MNHAKPYPIAAFNDNYIWAIVHPKCHTCWVVDPGDAQPVIKFLSKHALTLAGILLTHHHQDHQGGVKTLCEHSDMPVWMPKNGQCQGNRPVDDGDVIVIDQDLPILRVMRVPGHTLDHIAYVSDQWLFCGDTLFSGGCGRVFEGTHDQMHASVMRLAMLPEHTQVFAAHEYTLANLAFAQQVEPSNTTLQAYRIHCQKKRARGEATLPSLIGQEREINPFLRCNQASVRDAVIAYWENQAKQKTLTDGVRAHIRAIVKAQDQSIPSANVFALLREWKNSA